MGCSTSKNAPSTEEPPTSAKDAPAAEEPPASPKDVEPELEYASTCFLPTTWLEVPLVARREYNHDSTIYSFGLPEEKTLGLPVCACVLMLAPGRGRKEGGGRDDWDGSDAVRP